MAKKSRSLCVVGFRVYTTSALVNNASSKTFYVFLALSCSILHPKSSKYLPRINFLLAIL